MIINKLSVKNRFLKFENEKIQFDRIGLYLMTGKNGVGKSSIIHQVIFGKNDIDFNTEDQKRAYEHNREKLIAYVPQNMICSDRISVFEYITKQNKDIVHKEVCDWLERFQLQDISLETRVKDLSGGEKTKLCIISAILKNTPYIFLDEPTNNLDNQSVECLKNIINALSTEKTVVVISHDKRFSFEKANHIRMDDTIIQSQNDGEKNMISPEVKNSNMHTIRKIKFKSSFSNMVSLFLIVFCMIGMALFNHFEYENNYCVEDMPTAGSILVYQVDLVYGELNKTYVETQGFVVDDIYSMMKYEDISQIVKKPGIEAIYIFDEKKYNDIMDCVEETDDIPCFSVPEIIRNNYSDQVGISEMCSLVKGEMPKDNTNEIVLSENIIGKMYPEENALSMIGQDIHYKGKNYKLVGVSPFELAWVSYQLNDNLLFYWYDDSNYNTFVNSQITEKKEKDYVSISEVNRVVFVVDKDMEKVILNDLIENYSADNYYSYVFANMWRKNYNKKFYLKLGIVDTFVVIILYVIVAILVRRTTKEDVLMVVDYINYYLNPRKIICLYLIQNFLRYGIVILTSILMITLLLKISKIELGFLCVEGILLMLCFCGNNIINLKKGRLS